MEPGFAEFLSFLKSILFLLSLAAVPVAGAAIGGFGMQFMYWLAPSGLPLSPDNTGLAVFLASVGGFLVGLCVLPRIYQRLYKW